jgi:hypothetical protein
MAAVLALLGSGWHAGAAHMSSDDKPPVIPVGYDAYRQWDRWAYQRIGVRAYMRSTFDRTGGNEIADAGHFLYQLADDRNVTVDIEGRGMMMFARYNHWHGSPWHYEVDGRDHVVQESSTADPLHPKENSVFLPQHAFAKPLAYTWSDTKGADLSWIPVGFDTSFRMMYERTFYGTGYYIFHQYLDGIALSHPIAAWSTDDKPAADVLALIDRAGTDIAPKAGMDGVREDAGHVDLGAGASVPLWSHDGAAQVRAIELSVPRDAALAFSNARIRITWDRRSAPSVDAPVALFFGAGVLYNRDNKEYLVKSFPMTIRYAKDRVYLACYFPMPFFRHAEIKLIGAKGETIRDVQWRVRTQPFTDAPNHVGYFHATYMDHDEPESHRLGGKGADLVLLNTQKAEGGGDWSGSFVGTSIVFSDNGVLSTLEGDPRFFFDDSNTPQAQGTGTEEWGGGGDYWGGVTMTLPFAGHPTGAKSRREAVSAEDKIESSYRFLLADLMPFGRNALIQLERGGENESAEHYQTVAYWYGLPAASLLKTDEFAVGDAASEVAHAYRSPDASGPYDLTSRYEWGPDTRWGIGLFPALPDKGRTTKTQSEFTLAIDPANVGVMLRRKLDYAYPNQRAEVSVRDANDPNAPWQAAGTWYTAGSNTVVFSNGGTHSIGDYANPNRELGATEHIVQTSNRRFRDDEFLVPAALTKGRSAIRVRVKFLPVERPLFPGHPLPELAWSEMRYSAYSYVMPRFTP